MSCVIAGSDETAKDLGLEPDQVHAPGDFARALRFATRLVVIGPRLLDDVDFAAINRLPTIFVLSTPEDMVHMTMHLRDARLILSPCDAVVLMPGLERWRFSMPWLSIYERPAEQLAKFARTTPRRALQTMPKALSDLPKDVLTKFGQKMLGTRLFSYSPVVAASKAVIPLNACLTNPTHTLLAHIEGLPADVICAEPEALPAMVRKHPQARTLMLPVVIGADTTIETVNHKVTTAVARPVNLVQAVWGDRLTDSRALVGLVYWVG